MIILNYKMYLMLHFRVSLNRVTSVSIVPQSQVEQQHEGDQVPMRDIPSAMREQNFGGQQDGEEYSFRWQEKVFCQVRMTIQIVSSLFDVLKLTRSLLLIIML